MDGMLSQDEINALLSGMSQEMEASADATGVTNHLSDVEEDAIGEISNISMGTAATTLSTLVNNRVVITAPVVSYSTISQLSKNFDKPCVFIQISYREGLDGKNILILRESDVKVITDLMMGGDGTNVEGELSELHLSAISEAMNQMMGSAATSISSMLEKKVDISPPQASLMDLNDAVAQNEMATNFEEEFVLVSFKMEIENLVDSQIMQLYPFEFAKALYQKFLGSDGSVSTHEFEEPPVKIRTQPEQPKPNVSQKNVSTQENFATTSNLSMGTPMTGQMGMSMPQGMSPGMPYPGMMQDVNVQPAQFQTFSANVNPIAMQENIDLIMDVPLEVTVELGRTNKSIKEILDFSPGTIIELNKLAGEPIDVLVNGKFVAKGEVVVIEESFGIRVTEIIK